MESAFDYAEKNQEEHLSQLIEFLKIQSVSADPKRKNDIRKCANWLVDWMKKAGFEHVEVKETGGHPAVYADWLKAEDKPTVLVYGHYDVQPEDPIDKWNTQPFEPVVKNGYIYGRGTSDDKGQLMTQLFALEAILKSDGKLPVNIKLFIEGEEEGGTGATDKFVEDNADLLSCSAVTVSDTSWHSENHPSLVYALKGMCYLQVDVSGPSKDLHSGSFGGLLQNPINAMAHMISKLQDDEGRILIPGFYDDVCELTQDEKNEFNAIALSENEVAKLAGVDALWGEKGFTAIERSWGRPTLDVHGVWGGFAGDGSKTVIPSECGFKVSSRLVANQDPKKIFELHKTYIEKICPKGIHVNVKFLNGGKPLQISTDNPYLQCAKKSLEKTFDKKVTFVRNGASIPITTTFTSALKAPSVLIGYGLEDDNIHSPNEKFKLSHFYDGIKCNINMYKEFSNIQEKNREQ